MSVQSLNHDNGRNSLSIPQLSYKSLDPIFLSIDDQLSKNSSMSSCRSSTSDPPFRSSKIWRVNDEFVRFSIERCGRFETGDVGSVSEFGHCETSDHPVEADDSFVDPVA